MFIRQTKFPPEEKPIKQTSITLNHLRMTKYSIIKQVKHTTNGAQVTPIPYYSHIMIEYNHHAQIKCNRGLCDPNAPAISGIHLDTPLVCVGYYPDGNHWDATHHCHC